jgi:5-methylcytosine-specific restriction protein A
MPTRPQTVNVHGRTARQSEARPSPSRRGYGRAWQRIRLVKLAADPLCEDCAGRGVETAATEVDHVLALARGGTHDADNLRSLCKPCHSRKTVREDGGLGR